MTRVEHLMVPDAIKSSIVITNPKTSDNHILFVHRFAMEKESENSSGNDRNENQNAMGELNDQLIPGVRITYYIIDEDDLDEVIQRPKKNINPPNRNSTSDSDTNVVEKGGMKDFIRWGNFKREYAEYEVISHPKHLDQIHVK